MARIGRPDAARGFVAFAAVGVLVLCGLMVAPAGPGGALGGLHQADKRLGAPAAPVVVTEYVDLLCGACAEHSARMGALLQDEVRSGRVVIERMPLAHARTESRGLAYAALAAAQQDRLWDFTELWFARMAEGKAAASAEGVMRVARDGGLDMDRFAKNLADMNARALELHGVGAVARNDGVAVTPTLIITGAGGVRHLSGLHDVAAVRTEIAAVEGE